MTGQAEWWCWKEKSFRLKQEFSEPATRHACFATLSFDIINITITNTITISITIQVIVIINIGIHVVIRI